MIGFCYLEGYAKLQCGVVVFVCVGDGLYISRRGLLFIVAMWRDYVYLCRARAYMLCVSFCKRKHRDWFDESRQDVAALLLDKN